MRSGGRHPALVLCLILLLMGCPSGEETGLPEGTPDGAPLEECPRGDGPWREALRTAEREDRLAALEDRARKLTDDCPGRWEPTWTVGECLFRGADPQDASASYEEALRRANREHDPVGTACTANRLGFLLYLAGEYGPSREYYDRALAAAREACREDLEAFVLNNLAGLLLDQGDLAGAGQVLDRAIPVLERLDLEGPARDARHNRAAIQLELGDAAGAGRALEAIHRQAEQDGDHAAVGHAALLLGNANRALGQWPEARAWYGKVPRDDPYLVVLLDENLAQVALLEGELEEARSLYERAARIAREHDLSYEAMLAEVYLAEVELRSGRMDRAANRLDEIIREADRTGARNPATVARWILGKVRLAGGQPGQAASILREVVGMFEEQGAPFDPEELGLRFLRERIDAYADLAVALVRGEDGTDLQEVLDILQSAHARALRHALTGQDGGIVPAAALEDLRRELPTGTVLLDYLIGDDAGVVLAVGHGRALAREIPGWRRLRDPLRRYRAALARPLRSAEARLEPREDFHRALPDGQLLTAALLDPVRPLLEGTDRILVVPDRELALLPPATLPLDVPEPDGWPTFLGLRYETAFLPLAGLPAGADPERLPVLLAGDPLPDTPGTFPRLLRADEELRRLEAIWPSSRTASLRGEDLTAAALGDGSLEGYRTIHLATHAVASSLDPGGCALILSRGERLGLDTLGKLSLGPALVILSACRTGEGEVVPGEGLIGLGRAFLAAGARGVMVSLWSVEDRAAADTMVSFHRHLRDGADPVRALARTAREGATRGDHPAYWAPFTILLQPELAR